MIASPDLSDLRRSTVPPFARVPVAAVAVALLGVLLALSSRYGYHRDELYFRMLGEQPALGYFDTPPLTPMIAKVSIAVFGDTVIALRIVPALLVALAVVLVALICRELGGGRTAQLIAAVGAAVSTMPLVAGHMLLTLTPDLTLWSAAILFLVKALRDSAEGRGGGWGWLAFGAVVGVATYNRQLITLLVVSVGVGILVFGPRSVLKDRRLWLGALLAVLLAVPNLIYQISNDWPQLQMAEALDIDEGGENRAMFVPLQFGLLGPPLAVIMIVGLIWLWRHRSLRFFVLAYPVACALTLYSGGRPDYVIGLLLLLFAAGCVPTASWMTTRGRQALVVAGLVLTAVVTVPMGLPVLPVSVVDDLPIGDLNETVPESIGWESFAGQVREAAAAEPDAVFLAENYGQAGAVDRYVDGLPIYSGHNELWWRGAPPADTRVVVTVTDSPRVHTLFESCVEQGRVDNGVGIENEEQDKPILVCRDPVRPWAELWPDLRHYS